MKELDSVVIPPSRADGCGTAIHHRHTDDGVVCTACIVMKSQKRIARLEAALREIMRLGASKCSALDVVQQGIMPGIAKCATIAAEALEDKDARIPIRTQP